LRIEDLLPAAIDELEWLLEHGHEYAGVDLSADWKRRAREIIKEWEELPSLEDAEDPEGWYDEIFDMLNEAAPPYIYFGGSDGDPASVGWWPTFDTLEEDARYGEGVIKVDDLSEVPKNYTGLVMYVDDHGGVTLLEAKRGELEEIWGAV
jgi:hypothetical protein